MTTRTELRARLVVGAGGATAMVAFATVAFACSEVMGPMTITPSSAPAGSVVKMQATGLKPYPAKYVINMVLPAGTSGDCMSINPSTAILKKLTTNRTGGFNVSVTIPLAIAQGAHQVCAVEKSPVAGQTGTNHETFTVT